MSPTEPRDGYMTVWEERKADIEREALELRWTENPRRVLFGT